MPLKNDGSFFEFIPKNDVVDQYHRHDQVKNILLQYKYICIFSRCFEKKTAHCSTCCAVVVL